MAEIPQLPLPSPAFAVLVFDEARIIFGSEVGLQDPGGEDKGAAEVGNWVRRRIRTRTGEGIVGRNIILCFDGTNDEYSAVNTNVVQLYALLDRNRTDQLAYYQPGIGTFTPPGIWGRTKRRVFSQIDLVIGWFLEEHVTRGYRFLMRHYQPSDRLCVFA